MKTYSITCFIFLMIFVLVPVVQAENKANEEIDRSTIPFLKWVGPGEPGTHEDYINRFGQDALQIEKLDIPGQVIRERSPKILIIASSTVYANLQTEILRYIDSITSCGYTTELYQSSYGTAEELKTFLQGEADDLVGCVFIGSLPVAWYEVEDDYYTYGYAQFPCDLFLMDLDGNWVDSDSNGKYDNHTAGTGDQAPEIFIGRIDASMMSGTETDLLKDFFDKDNEYWNGNMTLIKYGLTYTEDDWAGFYYFLHDLGYLYGSGYQAIAVPNTNRDDYLDNRLKSSTYEFIQLSCHSYSGGHSFTRGGWLYSSEVLNAPPEALGFNLFCCSALRYTDSDFLGGAYVFNEGQKPLTVTGSTKTGSMLDFNYFYIPLGDNKPMGTALKEWFEAIAPYDQWDVFWHYGMAIIGDPMISFLNQSTNPDIHVKLKNKDLFNGSSNPFGRIPLNEIVGNEVPMTIENLGAQPLNLTGSPDRVTLSGPDARYFVVTQQPLTSQVGPGESTVFKIRTKKTTVPDLPSGWEKDIEFTINIPNNDPDENPYAFTITMTVTK